MQTDPPASSQRTDNSQEQIGGSEERGVGSELADSRHPFISDIREGLPLSLLKSIRGLRGYFWLRILFIVCYSLMSFVILSVLAEFIGQIGNVQIRENVGPWISAHWITLLPYIGWVLFVGASVSFAIVINGLYGTAQVRKGKIGELRNSLTESQQLDRQARDELSVARSDILRLQDELGELTLSARSGEKLRTLLDALSFADNGQLSTVEWTYEAVDKLIYGVLNKARDCFLAGEHIRYCVYVPSDNDELVISRWECVGSDSKRRNVYYIGNDLERFNGGTRGLPGEVFVRNQATVANPVVEHEWYLDVWNGERAPDQIPYKAALYYPIPNFGADGRLARYPLGVLVFDSRTYDFDELDKSLVSHVAARLASLIPKINELSAG